jgi:tetratricopeptide (TPR) repeat protein
MKNFASIILTIFLLAPGMTLHAQPTTDEQLAAQYFQNKEYDKALIYYEKLFGKKNSPQYYSYYLTCLLEVKDYKSAEKVVKKMIKLEPGSLNYQVDLGYVYERAGDEKKSTDQYEKTIGLLKEDMDQVFVLGKSFQNIKQYDYAIQTYERARKVLKGSYPFNFEIAQIHALKGDYFSTVAEILDVLLVNETYKQSVEDALTPFFEEGLNTKKTEIIRSELIKRVQKYPDKIVFSEMLIWLLVQQRDYEAALIQAKALDKRNKEAGDRIMELASTFFNNDAFDVSIKAYQYVILKGKDNSNYLNARQELLNVMYKKIVGKNDYTQQELLDLETNYKNALMPPPEGLGRGPGTISLMRNLAHLLAFYLNKTDEAITILQDAINLPGAKELAISECKLELADILLMTGQVWDASLMYMQVEKAFKNDPLGQDAKFRNARLSYFIGDFKWAQSQLEVLRAATTKLIANDAMDLSLLISDNSTIDTNLVPLAMFARADLHFFRNNYPGAILTLDSIKVLFPNHSLSDDILFKKYQISMRQGKHEEAAAFLDKILKDYSFDILGDDACFLLGELYENKLNDKQKAMDYYQDVMLKFPGSLFTVEARKRFRRLRGDNIN